MAAYDRTMERQWQARLRSLQESRYVPEPEPPETPQIPDTTGIALFNVPWSRLEVGWDIAARAWARALRMSGLDLRLPRSGAGAEVSQEVGHLVLPYRGEWDVAVSSCGFMTARVMRPQISTLLAMTAKRRIVHTMFERSGFSEHAELFRDVDGIWVPCSWNRDELRKIGLCQAEYFPIPHFKTDPLNHLARPRAGRVFYWIGNWSPRKAPDNLVRAFLRAFTPDRAELILKTGPWRFHRSYPEPEAVIRSELESAEVQKNGWSESTCSRAIHVDRRALCRLDLIHEIHEKGDVYVSASRGEGFDLPAYEAKLAGRRIVTTDSGGPRDFLGKNDILIPASGALKTHSDYGWEPESTYIDYPLDALVEAFRRASSEPVAGDDWPRADFRAETVGPKLRDWLIDGRL